MTPRSVLQVGGVVGLGLLYVAILIVVGVVATHFIVKFW